MKSIDGILKLADNEFNAIVQNGKFRSREEIDSVYKLIDIVKDAHEIWCMQEELESGEEGMSSRGGSYRDGRGGSNRGGSYYEDGGSYYERRGRGRNASRDSRGRYNEGSYREGSYRDGGMMRRGSYYRDGGKEEFISELRELMQDAPDDQTKQQIQQMIQQMEQG